MQILFFILPDFLKFCRTCKCHVHYILRDYTVYFSSACTAAEGVPTLTTHPLACHLDSSCMAVDCCIRVSDITRNLHVKLTLDPCAFTMTLQMERYQVEVDLLNYNFGKLNLYQLLVILIIYRENVHLIIIRKKSEQRFFFQALLSHIS